MVRTNKTGQGSQANAKLKSNMKLNVRKMVYNKDFLCKIIYNKNYRVPVFNTFKLKQTCSETLQQKST